MAPPASTAVNTNPSPNPSPNPSTNDYSFSNVFLNQASSSLDHLATGLSYYGEAQMAFMAGSGNALAGIFPPLYIGGVGAGFGAKLLAKPVSYFSRAVAPRIGVVEEGAEVLFGQAEVSRTFTTVERGSTFKYAGQTIADVAKGLRSGAISASEIPIEVVRIDGQLVAVNNRSLTALARAGMKPTNIIDVSSNSQIVSKVLGRLKEMGGKPSTTIRIRGPVQNASAIE